MKNNTKTINKSVQSILFFIVSFYLFSTAAFANSFFEKQTVSVKIEAKSSTEAKKQALLEGGEKAIKTLFNKSIKTAKDIEFLQTEISTIAKKFIESYSIKNEKQSMIKYQADIIFTFYSEDLKKWLDNQSIEYIEEYPVNFTIIPIETSFFSSQNGKIWNTEFWNEAWKKTAEQSANFNIPSGDFEDTANISIHNLIYSKNPNSVNMILEKYNSNTIFTIEIMEVSETLLAIRITDLDTYSVEELTYDINNDLTTEENYLSASKLTAETLLKFAKQKTLDITDQEVSTDLEFYISSFPEILKIKQSLEAMPDVNSFEQQKSDLKSIIYTVKYSKKNEQKILDKLMALQHKFIVVSKDTNIIKPLTPSAENPFLENNYHNPTLVNIKIRSITTPKIEKNYIDEYRYIEEDSEQELKQLIVPEKANYIF